MKAQRVMDALGALSFFETSSHYFLHDETERYQLFSSRWGEVGIVRLVDGWTVYMQGEEASDFLNELDLWPSDPTALDRMADEYSEVFQPPQD